MVSWDVGVDVCATVPHCVSPPIWGKQVIEGFEFGAGERGGMMGADFAVRDFGGVWFVKVCVGDL